MKKENTNAVGDSFYLIVGSGRLATHFRHYFNKLHLVYSTWNRKQPISVLKDLLLSKPTVILAISDKAIEEFYNEHLKDSGVTVVQCSGALHVPPMISCHPLMTFGEKTYDLQTYQNIHFAVTGIKELQEVFPDLKNSSFVLAADKKPLYHALCVLSAAGAQTLWKNSAKVLQEMKVPGDAYSVYLMQIVRNYIEQGSKALTGPWVRNDEVTIEKNKKSLEKVGLQEIYELLRKESV